MNDSSKKPSAPPPKPSKPAPTRGNPGEALVSVPWLPSNGYVTRRFDGKMSLRQGVALRLIHEGIKESGAKIHSPTDAIRYVLDKIADEVGISPTGEFPGRGRIG